VAHELNNPLTVLSAQAQLLNETQDPALRARATKIRQAAERCVRIVRNFLAFARQREPERSPTLLGDVVRGALELLAYELRVDGVEVAVDLAPDLPVLWADPHQLHQVLVNLVANAHHALRRHPPPRPPAKSVAAALPAARPGRVLIVDDEPEVAEALSEAIRREGHEVDIVGDGAEALGRLAARPYDVIVSDTKMPVLDGESFYRE